MLVEDEFEDRELTGPLEALRAAGATVTLVGPTAGAEYRRQARRGRRHVRPRRRRGEGEGLRRARHSRRPRARQDAHAPRDGRSRARRDGGRQTGRRHLPRAAAAHLGRTRCAAARSPAGRRSPSTSRTPAASTSTSRSSRTATSSPRASRTMCRCSARRSSARCQSACATRGRDRVDRVVRSALSRLAALAPPAPLPAGRAAAARRPP